jgi:hypothetical protein
MSLATKNVATVFVGLGLVFAMTFAFAAPAKADLLSDLQAQVQALLAQISAMGGGSTTTGAGCYAFTVTAQLGTTHSEVVQIQKFLNSHGAVVSASGAGSVGNESNYFGAKTKAAVAKWQAANGVSPAAGYWGPVTRAKVASVCGGSTGIPGVPVTGNGLKVMLSADSPNNVSLVQGQAIGEVAKFTFANPTGSEVSVTNLGFKRIGTSADSTLANVYLFNGATRITDAAGISSSMFNYNDANGIFRVPAGGTVTISVRADITTSTGGQQVGVQLLSVAASSALDTTVVLPISGGIQTISSASMGTVAFTYNAPSGNTENPATDIRVFDASAAVGNHAAWLRSLTVENRGSADDNDIKNLKLFVDGVQVGNAVAQLSNGKATFDLTSAPKKLETGTRVIKVMADIVGGSGETFDIQIRRAADVRLVDAELNQPILSTDVNSYPVSASSANNIGTATLSITRKTDSPSDNIAVGASNVLLARYEVRASGESVKIEELTASTTVTGGAGLDNVKVFLNGVQVGSTQDTAAIVAGTATFTFGSSFIARQGQVEILEIYGDAKNAAGTNLSATNTIVASVTVSTTNTEGVDSGDTVTSGNLSATDVNGFTRTIATSSATLSKASGYGNQTMVAGTNNAKLGSFTISAGSTEGVNVNTLTVTLSSAEAASVTDLMLKDASTGTQLGSTKASPSTSNSFSVNLVVPVSGTKTIDVYGNIKSTANAGSWIAAVDGSGTSAQYSQSVTLSSVDLQTITVGSGTLTVSRDAGTPISANVIASTNSVHVGKFDFAAVNSAYTVQELKVKIPSDAATSVSSVTLKYKNSAGVEQTVSQALTLPSTVESHATATFTGLTFYVPQNDSADIDVYVDVPSVASGAKSGAAISVSLDAGEGFKARDGAGTEDTSLASADVNSAANTGYGTKYVKKSVPTLARLTTGYTANTVAAGVGLYRFTVTADAAGAVDWREISFAVSTTTADFANFRLYDVTGSAVAVGPVTEVNGGVLSICPGTSCTNGEAEEVGANSTKTYELRAGSVSGWGGAGDTITISFNEDSSAIANAAASTLHAGQSMVWSDRSANSHSSTTSDWTNGYLVKDTDNDTRSCQFGSATTCTP